MKPPSKPTSIFDLSFRGDIPGLLRAIADRIDAKQVAVSTYDLSVSDGRCRIAIDLDLNPKD